VVAGPARPRGRRGRGYWIAIQAPRHVASTQLTLRRASWPRAQLLRLQAENSDLKMQEAEDRRRIQHLLALTEPVAHEVSVVGAFLSPRGSHCQRSTTTMPRSSLRSPSSSGTGHLPAGSLQRRRQAVPCVAIRGGGGGQSGR